MKDETCFRLETLLLLRACAPPPYNTALEPNPYRSPRLKTRAMPPVRAKDQQLERNSYREITSRADTLHTLVQERYNTMMAKATTKVPKM